MFQGYVIRAVVQELNGLTGGRGEIGSVELESWPLAAHFYELTLHGKENANQLPLVHVNKVTVRVSIQSLLHRRITIDELLVNHPVVHAVVDRDASNNIPQHSPKPTGHQFFDLSIGHLLLSNGEIHCKNKKIPLAADLYGFGIEIQFDPAANRYKGSISYHDGRVHYINYTPGRHGLILNFNGTPSHISIESARATVGSSTLFIRGEVDNFRNPKVTADYDVHINPEDFGTGWPSLTLAGGILLSGKLHYQIAGQRPFLLNLVIDGQLASASMSATFPNALLKMRGLHAQYRLANGTLQSRNAGVELLGGHAIVDVNIQHLNTTPTYQVAASLVGVSLQETQQAIHRPELKRVVFWGMLDGRAEAAWSGTISDIFSHCDLHLQASPNSTISRPGNAVPVEGTLHLTYSHLQRVIAFRETKLRVASMTFAVQGQASDHSNLHIQASATDLHQLHTFISAFHPAKTSLADISGSAELKASMTGGMRVPRFVGQLSAHNLRTRETRWSSANVTVQVSPWEFVVQTATFVGVNEGRGSLSGSVGLRNWSYAASNPISANLSVQGMRVADLLRAVDLHYPVSGELWGNMNFHGSELDPLGLASIEIANAYFYDEPLGTVIAKVRASNGSVNSTMSIGMPAGSATVNLDYAPSTKAYNLQLDAPSIVLQDLHTVRVRTLPLSGVAKLSATGQGTLDNPRLAATFYLPQAEFRHNTVSQVRAGVRIANQRADLELSSEIADGQFQTHGYVNLTGDYYCEVAVDTGTLQLEHLLDTYLPGSRQGFRAQTELHAILKGPLRDRALLEAHVTIPTLSANLESLQVSAAKPIRVDYAHSIASIEPAEFRGSDMLLRVQGSVPLNETSPLTLNAEGYVDAGLMRMIQPNVRSSGVVSFEVHTTGSINSPSLHGQVRLRELALSTETAPLGLENLNGSLQIDNNRVRFDNLSGQVGGGELSLAGSILYWPSWQLDIMLQAKSVRWRYPVGFRMLLDSNLALTGKPTAATLKGRVLIDDFSFTPEFDLARLAEYFGSRAVQNQGGLPDSLKLAVAVQSKSRLSAASSLASVEGNLNLQVTGTAANPVIVGRTDLTSGELFYRGRRYQFQRGIVVFTDPNKTRPAVDVSATTIVHQYNLTLNLRGYIDRLNMSYSSDPPLPTADIINLIAVGTTTHGVGAGDHATNSIVASQVAGQVSSRMQNLTGISGLRIDPVVGGNSSDPSVRIGIQQRVTKNFLFTFSTDISQPGGENVEGTYRISQRWSVRVARDHVGGVSVNGRYHTKF